MMDHSKRLAYLFYRYYEKTCTQQEKDELFDLLRRSEYDESVRKLIEETMGQDLPVYKQDNDTAGKILEYIISHQPSIVHKTPVYKIYLRYAAAIFIVALTSFLIYYLSYFHSTPVQHPAPLASVPAPAADQCITLSDGSKVLLHQGAHIDFDSVFTGPTREVRLTGEAYFDIRHDKRPFIVHTGNVRTTVLGTAFNINEHDKDIIITVTKGKVRVENGIGNFGILRRNEQITVDRVSNNLKKTEVDADEILVWKKPYLLFNDVSMKEAVRELERRYHETIVLVNPALENCNVTATFTGGEPLEQVIKVLSKVNNMDYRIIDNHIELNGEGCK